MTEITRLKQQLIKTIASVITNSLRCFFVYARILKESHIDKQTPNFKKIIHDLTIAQNTGQRSCNQRIGCLLDVT